jgi:hypothetical protein
VRRGSRAHPCGSLATTQELKPGNNTGVEVDDNAGVEEADDNAGVRADNNTAGPSANTLNRSYQEECSRSQELFSQRSMRVILIYMESHLVMSGKLAINYL